MNKRENAVESDIQDEYLTRKKKHLILGSLVTILALIILALLLIFLIPKKLYIDLESNTVDSILYGEGGYYNGQEVTIKAENVEGYRFRCWTKNGIEISREQEYTFIVSEDTEGEYTANYDVLYTINKAQIQNGDLIVVSEAIEGEEVTIETIANDNYYLSNLYYTIGNEQTHYEITNNKFIMPNGNVTIYVEFSNEILITTVSNDETLGKVLGGNIYHIGDEVTLTTDYTGITKDSQFLGWYVEDDSSESLANISIQNMKVVSTLPTFTFTLQKDSSTNYYAVYSEPNEMLSFTYSEDTKTAEVKKGSIDPSGELVLPSEVFTGSNQTKYLVTSIGVNAFDTNCNNLTSIKIPSSIIRIGYDAFAYCKGLANVLFAEDSKIEIIEGEAFYECESLLNITIPSSVREIGEFAFYCCTSLKNVIFEDNSQLTMLDNYLFEECSNLISIDFGENSKINSIGEAAFYGCFSLLNIDIPKGVTYIGSTAFSDCESLTEIEIPETVTDIEGEYTFSGCSNLKTVKINSADIYNLLVSNADCGQLIENATEIKVLKTVVDDEANSNTYLNNESNFTKAEDGEYYVYTKVSV